MSPGESNGSGNCDGAKQWLRWKDWWSARRRRRPLRRVAESVSWRDSGRAVARAAGADALKTGLRLKAVASNSHRMGGWRLVRRGSCARDGRPAECTRENASLAPAAPTKKSGCDLRTEAQRSMYAHVMHLYAGHEMGGCKVQGQLHPPAVCLNEAESHARLKVLLTLRCCARTCRACSAVWPATSTAPQVLVGS